MGRRQHGQGVNWQPGEVVLFEGIEWVKEKVGDWWDEKEAERQSSAPGKSESTSTAQQPSITTFSDDTSQPPAQRQAAPFTGTLFQTDPIIERKSEFIGYAAHLTSPDQVPSILSLILSDKRVARATHPIINAWVCKSNDGNGVVHRDCDDDGETAAGGRLAHLLSILELENVIVVVTRWYGGVHLGPDRFKLINRAAREALDLVGLWGSTMLVERMGRRARAWVRGIRSVKGYCKSMKRKHCIANCERVARHIVQRANTDERTKLLRSKL